MKINDVRETRRRTSQASHTSLDAPISEDGTRYDRIQATQDDPEGSATVATLTAHICQHIETLPVQEQAILALHYFEHMPFSQVSEVLGLQEAKAVKIHGQTITGLLKRMQEIAA